MAKNRIQVYADDETKRRIELAAFIREVSVTDYCLDAIRRQMAEDDVLEQGRVEVRLGVDDHGTLADEQQALRRRILARRGGRLIDMAVLDQVREEEENGRLDLR
jgi:hypothetical protein